jgi:hypothetical protein
MSRLVHALALCLFATGALAQADAAPPGGKAAADVAAKSANSDRYADCVQLWDRGTHMSRSDWSRTCRRIENRLKNLQVENLEMANPPAKGRKKDKLPNAG